MIPLVTSCYRDGRKLGSNADLNISVLQFLDGFTPGLQFTLFGDATNKNGPRKALLTDLLRPNIEDWELEKSLNP